MNLIDTPGHVDFNYEVSRSLAACEGALLVVDAAQGIEAQTLGNTYLAIDAGLEVVPVINKIDLPAADAPRVKKEIEDIIGIPAEDCPADLREEWASTSTQVLERSRLPTFRRLSATPMHRSSALIFDSQYDPYKGVIVYMRLLDGTIPPGHEGQNDGDRRRVSGARMRLYAAARPVSAAGAVRGRGRLLHRLHQKGLATPVSAIPSPSPTAPHLRRSPATVRRAPWFSAASIPRTARKYPRSARCT